MAFGILFVLSMLAIHKAMVIKALVDQDEHRKWSQSLPMLLSVSAQTSDPLDMKIVICGPDLVRIVEVWIQQVLFTGVNQ